MFCFVWLLGCLGEGSGRWFCFLKIMLLLILFPGNYTFLLFCFRNGQKKWISLKRLVHLYFCLIVNVGLFCGLRKWFLQGPGYWYTSSKPGTDSKNSCLTLSWGPGLSQHTLCPALNFLCVPEGGWELPSRAPLPFPFRLGPTWGEH